MCRPHHAFDGGVHALKCGPLALELLSPGLGDPVDPDLAVSRGTSPFGIHPALAQLALHSGIKRAFFNLQQISRCVPDTLRDRVAVECSAPQGLQHHHLQRPREQIAPLILLPVISRVYA